MQEKQFQIHNHYIKKLNLTSQEETNIFLQKFQKNSTNVLMDIEITQIKDKYHETTIHINCESFLDEKKHYKLELKYAALLSIIQNINKEAIKYILAVKIPKIIFPFAREVISSITLKAGTGNCINLDIMNFDQIYEQQKEITDKTSHN